MKFAIAFLINLSATSLTCGLDFHLQGKKRGGKKGAVGVLFAMSAGGGGKKGMSMTASTSVAPIFSAMPSISPSTSSSPSVSAAPSNSAAPSQSPSISFSPSASQLPSMTSTPSMSPTVSLAPSVSLMPTQDECATNTRCQLSDPNLPRQETTLSRNDVTLQEAVEICRDTCEVEFQFFEINDSGFTTIQCVCYNSCLQLGSTDIGTFIIYPLNGSDCDNLVVLPLFQSCNRMDQRCIIGVPSIEPSTEEVCARNCRGAGGLWFSFNENTDSSIKCRCHRSGDCDRVIEDDGWIIFSYDSDDCGRLPRLPSTAPSTSSSPSASPSTSASPSVSPTTFAMGEAGIQNIERGEKRKPIRRV